MWNTCICIRKLNLLKPLSFENLWIKFIISPDESRGYIGFRSVAPPPPPWYILTCVHDNSKTVLRISFKLSTHMYLGQERNPILR